jgi:hypothetical protein
VKIIKGVFQRSIVFIFVSILLILMILIIVSACNNIITTQPDRSNTQPDGKSNQPIDTSSTSITSSTPATTLPYKSSNSLTLSKAPKIGETAELTLTIDIIKLDERSQPREGLAKARVSLEFYWTNTKGSFSEAYTHVLVPARECIISGEIPWEGSYTDVLKLHSTIQLPREGIWNIQGHFTGEGWTYNPFGADIEVAVADDTAAIMGTEDFQNGPLAYLINNSYAGGVRGPGLPTDFNPVSVGLDISKAPRPGEEVTLSCRIISLIDVHDFSIQWSFYRGPEKIPETEFLTSKDLDWKIDLKKDEPVIFSTVIKFPTEGDWDISAVGKSGTNYLTGSGHRLKMSITSTRSFFGWIETPITIRPTVPGTGTTTTAILP